jgi:outer membrane protein OmpA-like peptidoglycan-associated protein
MGGDHEARAMKIPYAFRPFEALGAPLLAALLSASCATTPPVELMTARAAYRHASTGPAAVYAPTELHSARVALDRAEESFTDVRDPEMTIVLSSSAQRMAQHAETVAALAIAEKKDSEASQREANKRADASERRVLAANRAADDANDAFATLAATDEERGTVITLSGSMLFGANETTLLPAAQSRLNQVADALVARGRAAAVEGYTDSSGSQAGNLQLSRLRAESVRTYLVSRGVPGATISARGMGPDRPVAANTTAEGRANNRRVEIVVAKNEAGSR